MSISPRRLRTKENHGNLPWKTKKLEKEAKEAKESLEFQQQQQKAAIDTAIETSKRLSSINTVLAFGVIGTCYTMFFSTSPVAVKIVEEHRLLLFRAVLFGVCAIIFEITNLWCKFIVSKRAAENTNTKYKYKEDVYYFSANLSFYMKLVSAFVAAVLLLRIIYQGLFS